ncbi:NAD-dependent epimerase/dehydratase family protein [bacterium]|nr:NAD-dependent epimerase/dehydratase family protein [bacterium]
MSNFKDKNVLIIGGAGMIGSTLARLILKEGAKVTILDAMLPLYGGNMYNLNDIVDDICFVKGDIRDKQCLQSVIHNVDYVFNLAAQVSYVRSNNHPLLDLDINCKGIINILETCRKNVPEAKIIFSSSRFVYGTINYNPVDESHPFNCLSIYGIHKLAGEKYHRFYYDYYGLNTVSIRIANPYGPRQQMAHNEWGIINWFIRLALDSKPLTVFGDGLQRRDYIFVEDIAEALMAVAISSKTSGNVYNVGSGIGTPFIEMTNIIADLIPGTIIEQLEWPKDRYFVETGDYISDINKINKDTGFSSKINILEGIQRTINFYQENRDHYWK